MTTRVYIADDDYSVRLLLKTLLDFEQDYECIGEAENGHETLEFVCNCDKDCPDVIVLDLNMPGMDGHEVIRQMRENCPHIHIIVWSGENEEVARRKTDFREIQFVQKGDPQALMNALYELNKTIR